MRYQTEVMANLKNAAEAGVPKSAMKTQNHIVEILSTHIEGMYQNIEKMVAERHKAHQQKSTRETALYLCDKVKPLFLEIRSHANDLALYVEDKYWPLPKYREILFNR